MCKPLSVIVSVTCILLLAGSLALAGPRGRELPSRYLPGSMDGRLDLIVNPADGREWSAWAYRNGAEYDIAVSHRDDGRYWSEPVLIGLDDGLDQAAPVLAVDLNGSLYLAYAERSPERIMLTWLPAGGETWAAPEPLTAPPGFEVSAPELKVLGEHLIVAFHAGEGTAILVLPLVAPLINPNIFNDGPDPVEVLPPGDGSGEEDESDPTPGAPVGDLSVGDETLLGGGGPRR